MYRNPKLRYIPPKKLISKIKANKRLVIATIATVILFTLLISTKTTDLSQTYFVGETAVFSILRVGNLAGSLLQKNMGNIVLATAAISITNQFEGSQFLVPKHAGKTDSNITAVQSNPVSYEGLNGALASTNNEALLFSGACSGTPVLTMNPNPASPSSSVSATVSGLSQCSGTEISIKSYQGCSLGSTIATFTSGATGGSTTITSPSGNGNYGYWACEGSEAAEATLTVSPSVCSGTPVLTMSPNPASGSSSVTAAVSGLNQCSGVVVSIKSYQGCATGSTLATFTSGSTGGSTTITSPGNPGNYGYWACEGSYATEATLIVSSSSTTKLLFAIYTTNSTLLTEYKAYFGNGWKGILIDDSYSPKYRAYVSYWNISQSFPRLLTADNYSQIISNSLIEGGASDLAWAKKFNFGPNDYFAYDAEGWSKTPIEEQENQSYWVTQVCNAVHAAGYKCGYTPQLGGWIGEGQWEKINWKVVDYVELQEQGRSGNTTSLVENVTHLVSIVRASNPNTVIFVDLNFTPTNGLANILSDIAALSLINGVDGVQITYLPSGSSGICPYWNCNTNNLNTTIKAIATTQAT